MIDQQRMALVVDDEPDDLEVVRHTLASAGYNVKAAMDGKTAIEIFRAHAEEIEILVTDVAMSPMTGCDLAAQLVQLKWNLRVVFVSGYSGAQAVQYQGGPVADFAFVPKPFSAEELLSKVAPQTKNLSAAGR
jgi:CheY-like chemotaxis protein